MNYESSIISDDFIIDKINLLKNNVSNENIYFKKKKLIELSKNLSKLEYLEIFNIIQEDKCPYSENKNGIFINLSNMNEVTIDKIFDFINFIKHKREDLLKHEELINDTKKNLTIPLNKNIIENIYINQNDIKDDIIENIHNLEEDIETNNYNGYLEFSSEEEDDLDNKLSLKKKKNKYSGNKAKMIKSIKLNNSDQKKDLNT
jgi:hypothetical protein